MPVYEMKVTYQRIVTYEGSIMVEAPHEEAAIRKADDANMAGKINFEEVDSDGHSGPDYVVEMVYPDDAP